MRRLIHAFRHSMRALSRLARNEAAVQQELALLLLALPVAAFLAGSLAGWLTLVGAVLFLLVVEVLNTAVENACDAITREFRPEIQLAKDCGSLAVLLAILLVGGLWAYALWQRLAGAPI